LTHVSLLGLEFVSDYVLRRSTYLAGQLLAVIQNSGRLLDAYEIVFR
jgi:hypothetical protein